MGALAAVIVRKLTGRHAEPEWPEAPASPPDPHPTQMAESASTGDTPEGARSS